MNLLFGQVINMFCLVTRTLYNLYVNFYTDGIPPDGTPVMVITPENTAVIALHLSLFATSTLFVIICLGFNIVYKNRK